MAEGDWPEVRRIYAEGIATGDATFETEVPGLVALGPLCTGRNAASSRGIRATRTVVGWAALSRASSRRVYAGVAWESVYVADAWRGRGVGRALLEALIPASEKVGYWTLQAGILVENEASLALHERVGFRRVGIQERIGRDGRGRWRDRVLLERRSKTAGS